MILIFLFVKMPTLPQHYSRELIILIESMLNPDPKNRPTVGRILRDQFIKKNIMLFLERTKLKYFYIFYLYSDITCILLPH